LNVFIVGALLACPAFSAICSFFANKPFLSIILSYVLVELGNNLYHFISSYILVLGVLLLTLLSAQVWLTSIILSLHGFFQFIILNYTLNKAYEILEKNDLAHYKIRMIGIIFIFSGILSLTCSILGDAL
jgi:hypothetical protein